MLPTRRAVLDLYRRVLKLSQTWEARDPALTPKHREDIRAEARHSFRANATLIDEEKIRNLIDDTNNRIEISHHYGTPYKRPEYLNPQTGYSVKSAKDHQYVRKERKRPDYRQK